MKMTVTKLREKQPTSLHPAEIEFVKNNEDKYKIEGLNVVKV